MPVGSVGSVGSVGFVGSVPPVGVPHTWSSDTWPLPAPVLAVKARRTSSTSASSGISTVLPLAGSNPYAADALSVRNAVSPSERPSTLNVWVRDDHTEGGGRVTTTRSTSASAPRSTVRCDGYWSPAPSQ